MIWRNFFVGYGISLTSIYLIMAFLIWDFNIFIVANSNWTNIRVEILLLFIMGFMMNVGLFGEYIFRDEAE